ncbi:oligosaccharide repeat unit polymerase [Butyrivibrio sp. AE3004]|uniref:oligosaccharide repeat unit polymerase n=1 Tax=Butyrivibrio sp. AE3004 TaxID=1506994 RepID=UPI0004940FD7|nr:oligosaccharide repeat unit polymerase [Butyrivibrio sp. AE3004]
MIVFFTFIAMLIIAMLAYSLSSYKFFSLTFLSSAMFVCVLLLYFVFFEYLGKDITWKTSFVLIGAELFIAIGEILARPRVYISDESLEKTRASIVKNREFFGNQLIYVSSIQILFTSIFVYIVAGVRYMRLYRITKESGVNVNFFSLISKARILYISGEIEFGPILAAGYYITQLIGYIYVYYFMINLLITKKIRVALLFPVVGYCLCIVSTTARTEYIKLACAFVVSYLSYCIYTSINNINILKIGKWAFVFGAFFFGYGFAVRGVRMGAGVEAVGKNIVAYSCSAIYGIDYYLNHPWRENQYFGKYTLDAIYSLVGKHPSVGFEPFFFMKNAKSNIYTALVRPIQDYGILLMLFSRSLLGFVCAKLQGIYLHTNINSKWYLFWYIIECHVLYIFLLMPIGDKTSIILLNPKYLVEIIVAYIIIIFFGMDNGQIVNK